MALNGNDNGNISVETRKWMEEAEKYKKEMAYWKQEYERLKVEFDTLLETSLQQVINRATEEFPIISNSNSNSFINNTTPNTSSNLSVNTSPLNSSGEHQVRKKGGFPLFKKSGSTGQFSQSPPGEKSPLAGSGGLDSPEKKKDKNKNKKNKEKEKEKEKLSHSTSMEFDTPLEIEENAEFIPNSPTTFYHHLPRLTVCSLTSKSKTISLTGPETDVDEQIYKHYACGQSISTYPHIPGNAQRDGTPICDRYSIQLYENRIVACIADGCSWGEKPREAARTATQAFVNYINARHSMIVDVKKAGAVLLAAFGQAHSAIMEGKGAVWEAGTTTLLGGLLLEINKGADKFTPQWVFVCASVGDCKAFIYAGGEISDITSGNRQNVTDARDCGGRLGPHLDEGKPDLRNLNLFCTSCDEGDLIFMVTDGIHDNFDPQHLGKLPQDMPKEFNLCQGKEGVQWEDVDAGKAIASKNAYTTQFVEKLLDGVENPKEISNRLIEHCVQVTKKSRDYMESNNGKRIPDNYVDYPGKMDHTTVLAFKVGKVGTLPVINSPSSSPSITPVNSNSSLSMDKKDWSKVTPSQRF
eukprot:TRINITY_DN4877_c0_g1_i2.p1 TRINITY_DN4877_c0_g1~~TRINITY_DN4877_c0_g1_i2.p1  ORF type:complete len:582 (+),score=124.48 TRINITY_DN4877_c0_g1_i2:1929-3674(+)